MPPPQPPKLKTYRGTELDVTFEPSRCTHAGLCVGGLPSVFDTERRPWILPDGASAETVREVVAKCPSGALAVVEKSAITKGQGVAAAAGVEVRVIADGPLLVEGRMLVRDAAGETLSDQTKTALCRCGLSARKPFCDGAHAREGWTA